MATASAASPGPASTRPAVVDMGALLGLLAGLAYLWSRGRHTWYWTDEALSVGMSSHSLAQLPEVLAQDTSPPLYHVLLNLWMTWFGSSEAATHSLSLLFALAVVPAALWAGWSLFDRRTGWMCAVLASVSPFLAAYANESRMYSLVALLSLLVTATFLHAFVHRRRRFLPAFALLLGLALYTHYWSFFLALGTGVALVVCLAHSSERRPLLVDGVLAYGAAGLLFAPWLPTLLYQQAHTVVGWALPPTLQLVRDDVLGLFGGPVPAAALALGAGGALVLSLHRPWDRSSLLSVAVVVIAVVAVAAGWATSRTNAQWHGRYLGIVLAPVLLALGAALARAGPTAVAAVAVVAVLSAPLSAGVPLDAKSDAKGWAQEVGPLLKPDDLVFAPIGAVPLLAHYLPSGLRYATTTGPVVDPLAADWRDAMERLGRGGPVASLAPLVERLPAGGHVVLSCPPVEVGDLAGLPPYIDLEIRRCLEGRDYLLAHPQLDGGVALRYPPSPSGPVDAQLLTKIKK
jgi:mannosyltransferase